MAMLCFVCPATGLEVATGLEIDSESFQSLDPHLTAIACSHCNGPHSLAHVKSHLTGDGPAVVKP